MINVQKCALTGGQVSAAERPTRVPCSQSGCKMPYWDGNSKSGGCPPSQDMLLLPGSTGPFCTPIPVRIKERTLLPWPQQVKSATYLCIKNGASCPKEQTASYRMKLLLQWDRSCYGRSIFNRKSCTDSLFTGRTESVAVSISPLTGCTSDKTNAPHTQVTAVMGAILFPS